MCHFDPKSQKLPEKSFFLRKMQFSPQWGTFTTPNMEERCLQHPTKPADSIQLHGHKFLMHKLKFHSDGDPPWDRGGQSGVRWFIS